MRVLHIDTGSEMRGGQRQVLLLMRGLRDRGHECQLLARAGTPLWLAAGSLAFPVVRATLGNVRACCGAFDLLHAHDARAHALAAIASTKRFVVSRRVAFPVKRGVFSRWKYARAHRYLAVSRFVAEELLKAGVPGQKIDLVYDGFERTVEPHGPHSEFAAVALNSPDPGKGRALIEHCSKLAGVPVKFSEELAADLPKAPVFLYATYSEGLGSAVLLAMSLELAVIASRVGGLPEIIEDGVTGLLAENSPRAFAEALIRLRDDSELRCRLGRNGRARVETEFTADQMVERTLAAYERALLGSK